MIIVDTASKQVKKMHYSIQNTESSNFSVNRENVGAIAYFETYSEAEQFMIDCGLCQHEHLDNGATIATIEYAELGKIIVYYGSSFAKIQADKKVARRLQKALQQDLIDKYTPHQGKYRYDDASLIVFKDPSYTTNQPIVSKENYLNTDYSRYTLNSTGETLSTVYRTVYAYEIRESSLKHDRRFAHIQTIKPKSYKVWFKREQGVEICHDAKTTLEEVKEKAIVEFIKVYGF